MEQIELIFETVSSAEINQRLQKEMRFGTLRSIIRQSGIDKSAYFLSCFANTFFRRSVVLRPTSLRIPISSLAIMENKPVSALLVT